MPIAPGTKQDAERVSKPVPVAAERAIAFLERYRFAILAVFTVCYFVGMALRARSSPFWHDELYTILLSHLSVPRMWTALLQGVDPTPPMAEFLVKAANNLWGEGNVVSRIPTMIGFWVFCVCLFVFVRRSLNIAYAFAAMLLPFSTGAYLYALQARCYGLVLGFCAIALLSWQSAASGYRRRLALPVLALSLAAAFFSHFYAVLIVLPLAGAELYRAVRRKQIDWPLWGTLCIGPILGGIVCYPLIAGTGHFLSHPWAKPQLQNLLGFYPNELQALPVVLVVFLILAAAWWMILPKSVPASDTTIRIPEHEIAAAALFLTLPLVGFLLACLVTHMFTDRYFISAVAGVVLLAVFMAAMLSRGSHAIGIILLLAALPPAIRIMGHHLPVQPVVDTEPLLREAIDQGPLVMDDGLQFLVQWYYLPPALKSRVAYVSDPESDVRWTGQDTMDLGMRGLRRWFGVPVLDYATVTVPGNSFRIYHNASSPMWLPSRLLTEGVRVDVLQSSGARAILRATIPVR